MFVASELATAGSVIKKALRIVPESGRGEGKRAGGYAELGRIQSYRPEKMLMQVIRIIYQRKYHRREERWTDPHLPAVVLAILPCVQCCRSWRIPAEKTEADGTQPVHVDH